MATTAETEELVRYLVTSLVESPDAVSIAATEEEDSVTFEITLDPADVGKVIGRQGRIIKAIRTLARAAGSTAGRQVEVEIIG
ncbi:MAG: KH domain-containing protein [Coriobacteriia bacterium]|nr:KH domain-containing protein [Coriobacteriia bacterium]